MIHVDERYVKVWRIFRPKKDDAKYFNLSVSTSEKNRDDEWESSNWSATAVGHAFQQINAGDIDEDGVYSVHGKLTNVRRQGDDGTWQDNYRLTIFDFGEAGENADRNSSTAEKPKTKSTSKSAKKPAAKPASKSAHTAAKSDAGDGDLPW